MNFLRKAIQPVTLAGRAYIHLSQRALIHRLLINDKSFISQIRVCRLLQNFETSFPIYGGSLVSRPRLLSSVEQWWREHLPC